MHKCPVIGCKTEINNRFLMCAEHWMAVPYELRETIDANWHPGRQFVFQNERYQQAVMDALRLFRPSERY